MAGPTGDISDGDLPSVLLIGGPPRSGTTLLTSVLNQNPRIALLVEYDFQKFLKDLGAIFTFGETINGLESLHQIANTHDFGVVSSSPARGILESVATPRPETKNDSPRFYRAMGARHSVRFPLRRDLPDIALAVVRTALGKPKARVIGAKVPLFVTANDHLSVRSNFGRTRYLFALRNPLHQANSSLNRRNLKSLGADQWHIDSVDDFIAEYCKILRCIAALSYQFPEDCYSIKYEDLVENQRATIEAASTFLGLPAFEYNIYGTLDRGVINVLSRDEHDILVKSLGKIISEWSEFTVSGPTVETIAQFESAFTCAPEDATSFSELCHHVAASGWSGRESDGVWTDGGSASVVFGPGPEGQRWLRLQFIPHIPPASGRVGMRIRHNGQTLFDGELISGIAVGNQPNLIACPNGQQSIQVWLPGVQFTSGVNVFEFDFAGLASPAQLGMGQDTRTLGIKLQTIGFPSVRHGLPAAW